MPNGTAVGGLCYPGDQRDGPHSNGRICGNLSHCIQHLRHIEMMDIQALAGAQIDDPGSVFTLLTPTGQNQQGLPRARA